MKKSIPLMVPDIQQHDIDAVADVLRSGNLVQGEKVLQLEQEIARYLGVKHAIAASNGTATLHLAMVAMGIGAGDEVIVPALSYIATANVVELAGATPVFVDIDARTFNIDINLIEKAITPRTRAIMPVHEFGLACPMDRIMKLAEQYNLPVIEDAACALGARTGEFLAGAAGHVGSFSFHPRKAITSGEGGILVTSDDELARKLRILRNHGMEIVDGKMEFTMAGFNYRMTDFQAALVTSQLLRMDDILQKKNALAEIYFNGLGTFDKVTLPYVPYNSVHTWQSFHILVDDQIDRDALILALRNEGIGANYGAQCMPWQKYFREKYALDCHTLFPNAMRAFHKGLVLPLYPQLNPEDIAYVATELKKSINRLYA